MARFDILNAITHGLDMSGTSPAGEVPLTTDPDAAIAYLSGDDQTTAYFNVTGREDSDHVILLTVTFTLNGSGPDAAITITGLHFSNGNDVVFKVTDLQQATTLSALKAWTTTPTVSNTGIDEIWGNDYADYIRAGFGNDVVVGWDGNDVIYGEEGNDRLFGMAGTNFVDGGTGTDRVIFSGSSASAFKFTRNADGSYTGFGQGQITNFTNIELVEIVDGNHTVLKLATPASLVTRILGTELANILTGNALANVIYGFGGSDKLSGLAGNDKLLGGNGHDRVYGGLGIDTLTGGPNKDTFYFDTRPNARTNVDKIVDFRRVDDSLYIQNGVFTKIGPNGRLKADAFFKGKVAADAEDRVIYDRASGSLYYDADGTGPTKQIKFAIIANKAALTLADFTVI
jgi:serralysin